MEAQADYELECTLAVFNTSPQVAEAVSRLRLAGVPAQAVSQLTLGPGQYQAEDGSLFEEEDGARRGLVVGTPVGAALAAGLAAALVGLDLATLAALAVAGGAGGLVLGGFVGAITRTRFDDDAAEWVHVPDGAAAYLVMVRTPSAAARRCAQVRRLLRQAGAAAFLDTGAADADALIQRARRARPVTPPLPASTLDQPLPPPTFASA